METKERETHKHKTNKGRRRKRGWAPWNEVWSENIWHSIHHQHWGKEKYFMHDMHKLDVDVRFTQMTANKGIKTHGGRAVKGMYK